jgi:hypothetical protein
MPRLVLLLACAILAGCNPAQVAERLAPREQVAASRGYLDQLRAGDFADIVRDMHDEYVDRELPAALRRMAAEFPQGEPRAVKVIGTHVRIANGGVKTVTTVFDFDYGERHVVADVTLQEARSRRTIVGLNVAARGSGAWEVPWEPRQVQYWLAAAGGVFLLVGSLTVVVLGWRDKRRRAAAKASTSPP